MATAPPLLTVSKLEVSANTQQVWVSERKHLKKEKGPSWDWVVYRTEFGCSGVGAVLGASYFAGCWLEMAGEGGRGRDGKAAPHTFMYILSCLTLDMFLPHNETILTRPQHRIPSSFVRRGQWFGLAGVNPQLNCNRNVSVSLNGLRKNT